MLDKVQILLNSLHILHYINIDIIYPDIDDFKWKSSSAINGKITSNTVIPAIDVKHVIINII